MGTFLCIKKVKITLKRLQKHSIRWENNEKVEEKTITIIQSITTNQKRKII